jgi:hypothetical protein
MAFQIKANPSFEMALTLVGQGREQKLEMTVRHMPHGALTDLLTEAKDGKITATDILLKVIEKWNADADVSAESIDLLSQHQPGAQWAIIGAYGDALAVARKGN